MNVPVKEIGPAIGSLEAAPGKDITVIGTERIVRAFDPTCIAQAINSRCAPGVSRLVLNPDAHSGYGAPVGSVMISPTHVYPGPVGVDIKCSMSLLQLDAPAEAIADRTVRRKLIAAVTERTPTGAGRSQRSAPKARIIDPAIARRAVIEGASPEVCRGMGIPPEWAARCEDASHVGHDETATSLDARLERLEAEDHLHHLDRKLSQLGSYGGGNHFGEANTVTVARSEVARRAAACFGLRDGCVAFLSHCGSRGFGHALAQNQFRSLQQGFQAEGTPFPGGDRELVYAELGTDAANAYLDDMALGGNFATLNHLLINSLVLEAFQEVLPGTRGELVYFISHNIARLEEVDGARAWVHRKGATRAFPAHHPALANTPYADIGHPILLPGNPEAGSVVMVAKPTADISAYSVNHGAGRALGRRAAQRTLDQRAVDTALDRLDILSNCRTYPIDEAPAAYKDFSEVVRSVELAGLAEIVATLRARFVIKDGDDSLKGAA